MSDETTTRSYDLYVHLAECLRALGRLGVQIDLLEDRLYMVCRDPSDVDDVLVLPQPCCPLEARLFGLLQELYGWNARLRRLLSRLQLRADMAKEDRSACEPTAVVLARIYPEERGPGCSPPDPLAGFEQAALVLFTETEALITMLGDRLADVLICAPQSEGGDAVEAPTNRPLLEVRLERFQRTVDNHTWWLEHLYNRLVLPDNKPDWQGNAPPMPAPIETKGKD